MTTKVRLVESPLKGHTEKAYRFYKSMDRVGILPTWIPKSLVHHISRDMPDKDGFRWITVEVEDWFVEKNDL